MFEVQVVRTPVRDGDMYYVQLYCNGIEDRRSDFMSRDRAEILAAGWTTFYVHGQVPV